MRGKKTFDTSDWFATSEDDERLATPLNTFHASWPAKAKMKYGTPLLGRSAT